MSTPTRARAVVFEALFHNWKRPEDTFLSELQALGVDPADLHADYPLETMLSAVDVAARHVFPALSPSEGRRAVGREYLQGYFQTILGRMLIGVLKMMSQEYALKKMPSRVMADYPGLGVAYEALGPGKGRVVVEKAPLPFAEFYAGSLEYSLGMQGSAPRIALTAEGPTRSVLELEFVSGRKAL